MKKFIIVLAVVFAFFVQSAFADVITTQNTQGYGNYIYVAGSHDKYPVEYYDSDTKSFCGVIPDLLEEISKRSGLNFVYINGNEPDKNLFGENLQVDIVSSIDTLENVSFGKDYLELLSYEIDGETVRTGIVFTSLSQDSEAQAIKAAANEISSEERNGIYLSYAGDDSNKDYKWLILSLLVSFLLAITAVFLLVRIRLIRREKEWGEMTDAETGMGNLQFFTHHFKYTIRDISRNLYTVAYIVLDSGYIRSYHGDNHFLEVLKYTAAVLSEHTGDREISARVSENSFAFAFQATNDEDACKRLEAVMNKLNSFEDMKEKNNKNVFYSALYHLCAQDRNCEILLFNLKKNCDRIFGSEKQIISCDTGSMNVVQEEKKITENILKGFDNNEFRMYLQFIVDNKTKKIVSAEALSRWDSPEKGLISPGKYIENMEKAGLISKHDFYMFELVCRQLEKWKNTRYSDISISCNFTRITLCEENFIDNLKTISNKYSFDKSRIAIEITEDSIEKDREIATQNVRLCKSLGFKVYLDDLGSGYTSLANLCDYPIDVVKIDRDILQKTQNSKGKDLFAGIIALAHSLYIKVICEGVETKEQNEYVSASECDYIQGWFYSKVLPPEECESFVDMYEKRV